MNKRKFLKVELSRINIFISVQLKKKQIDIVKQTYVWHMFAGVGSTALMT